MGEVVLPGEIHGPVKPGWIGVVTLLNAVTSEAGVMSPCTVLATAAKKTIALHYDAASALGVACTPAISE